MKNGIKHIIVVYFLSVFVCGVHAQHRKDPYTGSRIFWDINSQTTVFSSGYSGYGRIIELQDGRLMAVAESGGIRIAFSSNKGVVWFGEKLIASNPTGIANAVPDFIQLKSGTILVGYNPRPREPYSEERKFGIRARRSIDNGETWSNEIYVHDALHTFTEGCWEPAFLELPSGEVQCYFANEDIYTSTTEQNISMCRSFDEGLTWSTPEIVSFRSGRRDGMPVPLLLEDKGEIVVMIEDNGIAYPYFRPVTVRTTIEDNWKSGFVNASSPNREQAFAQSLTSSYNAGAPYIRRLPSGETILSYQGTEGRTSTDYADMFVMVGDDEARSFKAKSQPFNLAADKRAKWNSLAVTSDGTVLAVGSSTANSSSSQIITMQGTPLNKLQADYGSIKVDGGKSPDEKWTDTKAEQLIMGTVTKSRWTSDFLYDSNYLYFTSLVIDRDIVNTSSTPDGIRLLIDAADVCTDSPQEGVFNILFQVDGTIVFKRGANGTWATDADASNNILYSVSLKNSYYRIEAAIPWGLLGHSKVNTEGRMAAAVERFDRFSTNTYKTERIADAGTNSPYTWMEMELLNTHLASSTVQIMNEKPVQIFVSGGQLIVSSKEIISSISLYLLDGRKVYSNNRFNSMEAIIPYPYRNGICSVLLTDGRSVVEKFL